MRTWLVALLIVSTALAGCSSDENPTGDDDALFEEFEDKVADGKGLIRGVVVDTTIAPIVDASITIGSLGLSTVSNENGAFQFTDLEPGPYFLDVTKPGFEPVQTSVTVEAGDAQPDVIRVLLEARPGLDPAYVPLTYDAFISCSFKTQNIVYDSFYCDPADVLGFQDTDDSTHTFDVARGDLPQHYQTEITWTANQQLSTGLVTIQCIGDNAGCGSGTGSDRMCNVRGPSPLVCSIPIEMPSEDVPGGGNNVTTVGAEDGKTWNGQFTVGLFSNCAVCQPPTPLGCIGVLVALVCPGMGVGLTIDQKVRIDASLFYNFQPDEGWLFTVDGEHPIPDA